MIQKEINQAIKTAGTIASGVKNDIISKQTEMAERAKMSLEAELNRKNQYNGWGGKDGNWNQNNK